ncbi:MAG: hypothetical protein JF591_02805, partial [Lysobacter sp.]|nr:hypothetical protein [Lysobacter sp.]
AAASATADAVQHTGAATNVQTMPRAMDATIEPRIDFSALDANRDGSVSRVEASLSPALTADFAIADRDADGRLSQRELAGWAPR